MLPRNIEGDPGKFLALPAERKGRGKSRGLDVGASISPGLSIRNNLRAPRTHPRRPGIVGTIENFSGRLVEQLTESRVDRRQIGIVVEMLGLDVEHDDVFRMVKDDRTVAFVTLGHEILAAVVPASVRAENRDFRTNIVRRVPARGTQHMRGHGRDGCFPVHTGHQNPLFSQHERSQRLRAPDHGFAQTPRRSEGRVAFADRRGIDDQLRLDHVVGPLRSVKIKTEGLQTLHFDGVHLVRPADPVAEGE